MELAPIDSAISNRRPTHIRLIVMDQRIIVAAVRERETGERRAALVPEVVPKLTKMGGEVRFEPGIGVEAGFSDQAYQDQGGQSDDAVLGKADVVLTVRSLSLEQIAALRENAVVIGFLKPHESAATIEALARRRVTAFSMDLMPRITRAQPMDALSAMSTIAGYRAVLMAANRLHKFFPLLMTAAGTVSPARVLVIGAGVAGLQAIGTARRLGAVVEAYDTRPVAREQVESLGAKCVALDLDTKESEDKGGYARAQSDEFYRKQNECLMPHLAASDVVISTALVPGKPAPRLISEAAVRRMQPGSVIIDLAAEQGGNCVLTVPGEEVARHGVFINGPVNLPSSMPYHASVMYARTVTAYLLHLVKDRKLQLDLSDELTRGPLVTHQGEIVHEMARAATANKSS